MELEQQKQTTLDNLLKRIEEGTTISERIEKDYRTKRQDGSFNPTLDTNEWHAWYVYWYEECQNVIRDNFYPSVIVTNRFKNAPVGAEAVEGENSQWNSLMKNINARLELMSQLYESVATIREDELSDFIELNVGVPGVIGAKIKVDKILSRFFRR